MPKIQELKSIPKNGKTNSYFTIAIPNQYMRLLGWKKGLELAVIPGKEDRTLVYKEFPKSGNERVI